MINAYIDLKFDSLDFKNFLMKEIGHRLTNNIKRGIGKIRAEISNIVYNLILNSPEVQSLKDGQLLAGVMGIQAGKGDAIGREIARRVADNIRVQYKTLTPIGKKWSGGIRISIIKGDYSDVLGIHGVSYQSDTSGVTISWLEWLLKFGDRIIISDYIVTFGDFPNDISRSGIAIMVKLGHKNKSKTTSKSKLSNNVKFKGSKKVGGDSGNVSKGWRVPPKFSGTEDNNFLTRAIFNNNIFFITELKKIIHNVI